MSRRNLDEEIGRPESGPACSTTASGRSDLPIYNQAIADAQSYFTGRVADLEGVCHEAEFGFWPRS